MSFFGLRDDNSETSLKIAKSFQKKLANNFGITFIQDHSGEFGDAGALYLTLRHTDPEIGACHMTMKVQKIARGML